MENTTTVSQTDMMVGHYRLVRRLGAGGFGKVYEAKDTTYHRRVALLHGPGTVPTHRVDQQCRHLRAGLCAV